MKKNGNEMSLFLSDFDKRNGSQLEQAITEAHTIYINGSGFWSCIRILADSGKCIKVLRWAVKP